MIRRSFLFSFAQSYSSQMVRIVSLVLLARLLSPDDFGVFASGQAIMMLILVVAEFGLTKYLIQETALTPERERTALGLSLLVSLACAACVYLTAAFGVGLVWDRPLATTVAILAVCLLVQPLTLPIMAMTQRQMRFDTLFYIGTFKTLMNVAVSVILAWQGFGYLSLACGMAAEHLSGAVCALLLLKRYPVRRPSLSRWREVFRFGRLATGMGILHEFGNTSTLVAGQVFLGYAAVGLLNRAQAVNTLFDKVILQAVTPVILPALGAATREGRDLKPLYTTKLAFLSAACWPFFLFVFLFAEPLVGVLLGHQWDEAVPVVRILSGVGLFMPFTHLSIQFVIVLGTLDVWLRRLAWSQLVRLALCIGAAQVSLSWLAATLVVDWGIKAWIMQRPIKLKLDFTLADLGRAIGPSLAMTAACGTAMLAVLALMPAGQDWSLVLVGAGVWCLTWLGSALLVHDRIRGEVLHLLGAARRRLTRSGTATA